MVKLVYGMYIDASRHLWNDVNRVNLLRLVNLVCLVVRYELKVKSYRYYVFGMLGNTREKLK
jgi:hypothetical protein